MIFWGESWVSWGGFGENHGKFRLSWLEAEVGKFFFGGSRKFVKVFCVSFLVGNYLGGGFKHFLFSSLSLGK